MSKQGASIEFYDDGKSKFDRVIGQLGEIEEGDRVCLVSDKSGTGIVKWIGRYHVDPDTVVDEEHFIVGVKLDMMKNSFKAMCSHGDLNNEILVPSTHKDIIFRHYPAWKLIEKKSTTSAHGNHDSTKLKESVQSVSCVGQALDSPGSKFDRIDLEVNGFHVGSRVKLDTGSVGTVRWIGCYHKKMVKFKDYIVGVELDSTAKEQNSLLTRGWYEDERLVKSKSNNIKFTKFKSLTKIMEEVKPTTVGGKSQKILAQALETFIETKHVP